MSNDRRLQAAIDALAQHGGNKTAAAKSLGMTRSSFRRLVDKGGAINSAEVSVPDIKIVGMQDEIRTLRAELKAVQRDKITADNIKKDILGLRDADPDPPKWALSGNIAPGDPGIPTVFMSDDHWAEDVNLSATHGYNEYNLRVGHSRKRELTEKAIHLPHNCIVHQKPYPGIVVCMGGDMVSGEIHEELAETNELPQFPAILDLRGVLIWSLDKLQEAFSNVFVVCVVGNHGRTSRKPRAKRRVETNCDWLLYQMLALHYQDKYDGAKIPDAKRPVRFLIPDDIDALFRVYDHTYMMQHGDCLGARGGDGIIGEIGPIKRGEFKVRRSSANYGREYNTLLMGHWHHAMRLENIMVNGSLKGVCEYAVGNRFVPEPPTQLFWFTRPDGRIVWDSPIVLDDRKPKAKAAPWVSWEGAA